VANGAKRQLIIMRADEKGRDKLKFDVTPWRLFCQPTRQAPTFGPSNLLPFSFSSQQATQPLPSLLLRKLDQPANQTHTAQTQLAR